MLIYIDLLALFLLNYILCMILRSKYSITYVYIYELHYIQIHIYIYTASLQLIRSKKVFF